MSNFNIKVNVEEYTRRLEDIHQQILDVVALQDNTEQLVELLNRSLPVNSQEVVARHMFRKFIYNLNSICGLIHKSTQCYILLLNIPEIVQFYGIKSHISWDRTLKKYIPTEDINATSFNSLPVYIPPTTAPECKPGVTPPENIKNDM